MKKFLFLILILSVLIGCFEKNVTKQMDDVDSLVVREQYDSAYASILRIDKSELNGTEDSAQYYLLLTQTSILSHHPDTLNMLDSLVIPYYKKVGNHEKLADAYYYKAYGIVMQGDISNATLYYKFAEEQSANISNPRLQYKIAESLSYTNESSGNHSLQLHYAHKAFDIAKAIQNKEWMAYALCRMSFAHSWLGNSDSAVYYMNKALPYARYISKNDIPTFLTNAAYTFKHSASETAKRLLKESLSLKEHSVPMLHLADIYRKEGNMDAAYQLWIKALSVNDGIPKDIVLQNILEYEREHNHIDHAYLTINNIIHIKDSMLNSLRNDTIKDLQLRFDYEVAMRKQEQVTSNWQKGVLLAVIIVLLMAAYIIIKRFIEKNRMQEVQMQINDFMNQIHDLEAHGKESEEEIAKLNKKINDYLDNKAPDLLQGRLNYERIKADEIKTLNNSNWKRKDEQMFIDYYTAIDYRTVNRLKKTKRKESLTTHKLFFLLLLEMGKSEKYIANLFGISERSIDTLKTRTKPIE